MLRGPGAFVLAMIAACGGAAREQARATTVESQPNEALPWCPAHPTQVGNPRHEDMVAGAIEGVVRAAAGRFRLSDVTVVATSPVLEGSASELTDVDGAYRLDGLPAGSYDVVFYYGELKARQGRVAVAAGAVTPVSAELDLSATPGEIVDVTQTAPTVESDVFPGPRDPNDPRGGRLWAGRHTSPGHHFTVGCAPLPVPVECRPRPSGAAATPAPGAPRGRR